MDPAPLPSQLLLFDGVCGMCNAGVNFLMRIDRTRTLRYAPLQGETTDALRALHPSIPATIDTVIFVDEGVLYFRSKAVTRVARYLPWPWKMASFFSVFPAWLMDPPYRLVAHFRYTIFGKKDVCRIPAPEERALFLP